MREGHESYPVDSCFLAHCTLFFSFILCWFKDSSCLHFLCNQLSFFFHSLFTDQIHRFSLFFPRLFFFLNLLLPRFYYKSCPGRHCRTLFSVLHAHKFGCAWSWDIFFVAEKSVIRSVMKDKTVRKGIPPRKDMYMLISVSLPESEHRVCTIALSNPLLLLWQVFSLVFSKYGELWGCLLTEERWWCIEAFC